MTYDIKDINKAVVYEIIMAMGEEGLNAMLIADDLLASMAVPATQYNYSLAGKTPLKLLMENVYKFIKISRLSVNSYTKAGLFAKLNALFVPRFSDDEKKEMIAEYRIVDGFDDEGYAIFNRKNYEAWKAIFDKGQIPRLEYKRPQFGKSATSVELIDDRPFTIYKAEPVDGYWCAPLDISVEEWMKIIHGASSNIKRMLQCYLQMDEPRRMRLLEMEERFGIKWESINACNVALGRRAQRMLNFAVVDYDDESQPKYWSTAMTRGRHEQDQFVWEPRPELMEAAEIVLREEKFPAIPEKKV